MTTKASESERQNKKWLYIHSGQLRDVIFPACHESAMGLPHSGTCLQHPTQEVSREHHSQMPKPSQVALRCKGEGIYFLPFANDSTPHAISNRRTSHPSVMLLTCCQFTLFL